MSKFSEIEATKLINELLTTNNSNKYFGELYGLHPNYISVIET